MASLRYKHLCICISQVFWNLVKIADDLKQTCDSLPMERQSISQVSLYLAKHLGKCSETLTFMSRCFTYVRRCAALAKYVYVRLDCAVSGTRSLKRKLFFNFFSFKFRKQLFKLQVWLNINPFFPNAPFLYPLKTCLHLRYGALGTNGLF